jgi:hypothetical protein
MRYILFLVFLLHIGTTKLSAQTINDFLNKTQENGLNNTKGFVKYNVVVKLKNYLDTKVSIDSTTYLVYNEKEKFLLKEERRKNNYLLFYLNGKGHHVYTKEKILLANQKRYNNLEERFQVLPFFHDKTLFLKLFQVIRSNYSKDFKVRKINLFFVEYNGSGYQLTISDSGIINSLKITHISKKYGTDYKEYLFFKDSVIYAENLEEEFEYYSKNFEWTNLKELEAKNETTKISKQILYKDSLMSLLNIDSSIYDFVLLDFIYRTCLPCIKAIPEINKIKDINNIFVGGIDPVDNDEGGWNEFIQRYKIRYKIFDGDLAKRIKEIIFDKKSFAYPTTVLFEIKTGKILLLEEGYSKKLYSSVLKSVKRE